jgi:hypothetical protein
LNDYITLDSKKYRTSAKTWHPEPNIPATERVLLNGQMDVTFGKASLLIWIGEIEGPITAASGWGTIVDLRTSLLKRQLLSFTDHYGVTRNIKATGPFKERSLSSKWDGASNTIYVSVKFTAVA